MALAMDPPWSSMGTGPLIFHGKPMEYFCKGIGSISKLNDVTQSGIMLVSSGIYDMSNSYP